MIRLIAAFALMSDLLCFLGFLVAKRNYRREERQRMVNGISVSLALLLAVHLLALALLAIYSVFLGHVLLFALLVTCIAAPFVIGYLGDNFQKADLYLNIQLWALICDFCVLCLFVKEVLGAL